MRLKESVCLTLDKEIISNVDVFAKKERRSRSYIINNILTIFFSSNKYLKGLKVN